jgi:hypothetical protein
MLCQAIFFGYNVGEISCPTKYFPEASSINFRRSCIYGIGVVETSLLFLAQRLGFGRSVLFKHDNTKTLKKTADSRVAILSHHAPVS